MSERYVWPVCTLGDCGHVRTHRGLKAADRFRRANTRRFTTPDGNAICGCHETWADDFVPPFPLPRELFRCDESK